MIPSALECPFHILPQASGFAQSFTLFTSSSSTKRDLQNVSPFNVSCPFSSKTTTTRRYLSTVKRSCYSNSGHIFHDDPSRFSLFHCEKSAQSPSTCKYAMIKNSFLKPPEFDFLEPTKLGIRPEAPEWPEREAIMWADLEHKAKSHDLPLSLRMVKKKLRLEQAFRVSDDSVCCPLKKAFTSMVFILVELQSYALQMREEYCQEDLQIIIAKVEKEMQSSYFWLFHQVFSRTPALMVDVMILLANYSVCSTERNLSLAEASLVEQKTSDPPETGIYREDALHQDLTSVEELDLWNSMVKEAIRIRGSLGKVILDLETRQRLVSPVSVELESDDYDEYLRTDVVYQIALSQQPNNPLLLCNYAQFLHLVTRDYDRAEECYKQAVAVEPPDAESLSQYATFLWKVRNDYWGAEERYLQALAVEPDNAYYASKYAHFLWNTGGEETCFPLDNSHQSGSTSNI